jgi:phosphoribosylglycinamide formyltransferase 1
MKDRLRLGVLISGSGTNLQAIIDASQAGTLDAEVVVVISNHSGARGLTRAQEHGIEAVHVDVSAHESIHAYNGMIRDLLREHRVDLVVMAGYMRLLGKDVLEAFPQRVINIHPALLPSFKGASSIKDAYDYGVKVTGVTVHFADDDFDRGPIIAQEPVLVAEDETLESLESKIHSVEHALYPRVIQMIAEDRVHIVGRRVRITPP